MSKEKILLFCAHSDDQILGAGATMAKYAKEGKDIYTIIFSYGFSSHLWLKKKVTAEMRAMESKKADKIIGGKSVVFLGLNEGNFAQELNDGGYHKRVSKLISNLKPNKIFTHAAEDPHPDHGAVHKFIMDIVTDLKYKCGVYSFDIWNPIRFSKRDYPKLVVNVSDTFKLKIQALKCFESQKIALFNLYPSVYLKAIINGWKNETSYAEVFIKEK